MSGGAVNYLKFLLTADGKQLRDEVDKSRKSVTGFVDGVQGQLVGLAGALAGFVGVGVVLGKVRTETMQAEREQALLGASLRATGNQAGYSQARLNDLAGALEGISTISAGEFNQAQTVILGFTNIVGSQVPKALMAAADYSVRTGADMKSAAEVIGRALDVPSMGMSSLQKQGFKFSESQIEAARQLERTGRVAEAQQIVLDALNETYGGAAVAARDTFGGALTGLQNQINSLLTGEGGSLEEAKGAVEGLTQALSSPEAKQAFSNFTTWLAELATQTVQTANVLSSTSLWGWLQIGKDDSQDLDASIADTERKISRLQDSVRSLSRPLHRYWNADDIVIANGQISTLQSKLQALNAQRKAQTPVKPATTIADELLQPDMTPRTVGSINLKDASGAKAQQQAYDSLIASIRTKREQMRLELEDDTKLTESQKLRIKLDQELDNNRLKLSASKQAEVRAELDLWAIEEKRVEARKGKKLTDELLSANAPLAADFADKWKLLSSAYDDTEEGLQRLIKAQAVLLAQQPFAQQATALAQARAEAEQYLAVMQQAQAREVAAVGMGGRRAEYQSGLNQIEDTYAGRRYDLSRDMQQTRVRNGGSVSPELQAYYDQQFALIEEFERKAKASYASTFQAIGEAQADWGNGARRAFDDYIASAANVADQTASLFTRAFQGMEDALVSFAMTGKADFKSMTESIIADLIRIQIRASMMQVLGGASGGGGLLGALVGGVSALLGGTSAGAATGAAGASYSLTTGSNYSAGGLGLSVSGGRADGGSVAAGSMYEVNERGIPELLNIGRRQYLMMGQQSGEVVPLGNYGGAPMQASSAGSRPTIEINIHNHTGAQVEQTSRTGAGGKEIIDVIIKRAVGAVAGQLADDSGEVGQAMRARKQMGMAV